MIRRLLVVVLALLLMASAGVVWLYRSGWFHERVRQRVVRELETATGGRVELGRFSLDWSTMHARVDDLVVHGKEAPGEQPLFAVRSVDVGLRIISLWRQKVDIASLEMVEPRAAVTLNADGSTNIPGPRLPAGSNPVARFLDFAVGRFALHKGEFRYGDQQWPLDVHGRQLDLQLSFDRAARAYMGNVSAAGLRITRPLPMPLELDAESGIRIEENHLALVKTVLRSKASTMELEGELSGVVARRAKGRFKGKLSIAEFGPLLRLPVDNRGEAQVTGVGEWNGEDDWLAQGAVNARGIAYRNADIRAENVHVRSSFRAQPAGLELIGLYVSALGGNFKGKARVDKQARYLAEGEVAGFSLRQVGSMRLSAVLPWNATVSGPVRVEGPGIVVNARLGIEPVSGAGQPIRGEVNVAFSQQTNDLRFEPSWVELPNTRANFSGDISRRIEVGFTSSQLDDLLPALSLMGDQAPAELPVRLDKGAARFQGEVSGGLSNPVVKGRLEAGPLIVRGRRAQSVSGNVEASRAQVRLTAVQWKEDAVEAQGYGTVTLADGRLTDASPVTAKLTVSKAPLDQLLAQMHMNYPVTGTLDAQLDVQGTVGSPRVAARLDAAPLTAWGETFEGFEADVRYSEHLLEIANGRLANQGGVLEFTGRSAGQESRLEFVARNSRLKHWDAIQRLQPRLDGQISAKGVVTARGSATGASMQLAGIDGEMRLQDVVLGTRRFGDMEITSRTRGRLMTVEARARLRESQVLGTAEWNLGGNTYGLGQITVNNLTFTDLQDLLGEPGQPPPVRGFLNAELGFAGPILKPESWTGQAKITSIQIEPVSRVTGSGDRVPFILKNRDPILAYIDTNGINLQSARLTAEGTDLEALGTVSFRARNPWNLRLRGNLNLPVLSLFEPDLLATGTSTLDATIRGSLDRPNLTGRMELRKAAFNYRGLPNGIDNANGTLVFDRTRANIEKLTAQTGGGDLSVTGFIDFAGQQLRYGLQGMAQRVRVRYPDDVSTTFNAVLNWAGTTVASNLTGLVTVNKVGLNPRTDIGSLLASASKSTAGAAASSGSPFLRGMQLDVRIETASDAELQTSLARDIAPEANLRLQGSAQRPVLFGRVSVNQGEIQFFGNQYTITRGDISFYNPVKIEPVMDLDLETKVRGITVNMNFSGPVNKLNVSYRSDPPLQSAEIVALLTVGRTPGTGITPSLTQNQTLQAVAGNNSLLGQAISAPLNSRLQRLFGVSRIKIDPELTGVTNTPQARLTVEQQLSRDLTVTYITNLNRTQQQIVRVQWDFSRDFSVLAVRDDNGVFGIDFLWRQRFK